MAREVGCPAEPKNPTGSATIGALATLIGRARLRRGARRPAPDRYFSEQTRRRLSGLMLALWGREEAMSDRLQILLFLEDAALQMARLAHKDGLPAHVAEELGRLARELGTDAAQLKAELHLDTLAARVANTNRHGLTGLSD
jgi:hypothetical protein